MATVNIQQWGQFTTTGSDAAGPANYGGAPDWLQRWSNLVQGGLDQTKFIADNRLAPPLNWATYVAWRAKNDAPLQAQNPSINQVGDSYIYPSANRNTVYHSPGTLTWNGFAWVGNPGNISGETFDSVGGER